MGERDATNTRRQFLLALGATSGALACRSKSSHDATDVGHSAPPGGTKPSSEATASATPHTVTGTLGKRPLGKTGVEVSMLGLGGYHIGQSKLSDDEAVRLIRRAIDNGITFLDNCWDYNEGKSEERVGKALRDGYRERAFVMTKLDGRTKKVASAQLDQSLGRLGVATIDLVQIHEVIRDTDPERCFAPDGAIHALTEAKKAGKLRFIGFTGHKSPSIHLAMLEIAKQHGFEFDTVQMPLNVMDAQYQSFGAHVLPVLEERKIGVLGMKSMGSGDILKSKLVTPEECLRYSLSLPTSVVISGMDSEEVLDENLEVARNFRPLDDAEKKALLARVAGAAREGKYELFKTSEKYDGTRQNPKWLEKAEI